MHETTTDLDPLLGDHRSSERMTRFYALAAIVVSLAMLIAKAVQCGDCHRTAMLDASTTTLVTQERR